VIEVRGVSKVYTGSSREPVRALANVSFEARAGRVFGLLGPNGAGKTTTLRIISTVLRPTAGSVRVCGHDTVAEAAAVRHKLGFLSGSTGLYERLTPSEVIDYFGKLHGLAGRDLTRRKAELFSLLEVAPFADRLCGTLSTGQKQKVTIARALVHDPPVLVFDEPTTGLDVLIARAVLEAVEALRSGERTIIFSTHILSEVERLCDDVAIIHRGELLRCGTKEEVRGSARTIEDAFFSVVRAEAPVSRGTIT
jgi:sodium transport system ATP-binding protein